MKEIKDVQIVKAVISPADNALALAIKSAEEFRRIFCEEN
jgi:hypothetical protein